MATPTWLRFFEGGLSETPVRSASPAAPPPTPATPPGSGKPPGKLTLLDLATVHDPRLANRLGRLLAAATASPVDGYVSEVVAAILLNQLGAEDLYPEELIGYGNASSSPGAGDISQGEVFNPVGSGVNITVEQVTLAQQTLAAILGFSYNTAALGGGVRTAFAGDVRAIPGVLAGGGVKGLISFDAGSAAKPATASPDFWEAFFPAGSQPLTIPTRIVLPPGVGLLVASAAQGAQTTSVSFQWRERKIVA